MSTTLQAGWLRALCMVATMALATAAWAAGSAPGDVPVPEPRIKAAFLFKFGAYVEWPAGTFASDADPITIGVMQAEALAEELASVSTGRSIDGRAVVVRRLTPDDPLDDLEMLFIGRDGESELARVLTAIRGRPTLAVTESEHALRLGSMVNFVIVDDRVRFDVAPARAQAGGLRISSRLLDVARRVMGSS